MAQPDAPIATLRALRELGVGVALDNFGTGSSSLASLQRLPLATLPIDRNFFQDNAENRAIAGGVTTLAHRLGLDATAEGLRRPVRWRGRATRGALAARTTTSPSRCRPRRSRRAGRRSGASTYPSPGAPRQVAAHAPGSGRTSAR